MENRDICMVIMFIIVIYLFIKIQYPSAQENFEATPDSNVEAIKNLGKISKEIMTNNGTLTIPANMTELQGNVYCRGDMEVYGNIHSDGWNQSFDHNVKIGGNLWVGPTTIYPDGSMNIGNNLKVGLDVEIIGDLKVDGKNNLPIIGTNGQKWVDVTSMRGFRGQNTDKTVNNLNLFVNTTPMPIQVSISLEYYQWDTGYPNYVAQLFVNDVCVQDCMCGGRATQSFMLSAIVPSKASYNVVNSESKFKLRMWAELTT